MKYTVRVVVALFAAFALQAHAQPSPQTCLGTFVGLNFNLRNYAAYNDYFHNESQMQLAQAGVYTGPVAIEEYVKFANPENPAIESRTTVNQTFTLTGISADTCEFYLTSLDYYEFNDLLSNGTLQVAAAFRLYVNVTSGKVDRVNVFYETEYLTWFGGMTAFPKFQAWLCGAMESGCPDTWSFNNLSSQAECVSHLAALPTTTGDAASFDGNSQACRALHGMLAGLNPEQHCPHISFAPQEDPNGAIKCQTSKNVQAGDLFTPEQVGLLKLFKRENGVPPSGFVASIPCDSDTVICPNDQVCVAGVCAEPSTMPDDNSTNTTGNGSSDDDMNGTTVTTTAADDSESSAAYSMSICTGVVLLVLAACRSTPF